MHLSPSSLPLPPPPPLSLFLPSNNTIKTITKDTIEQKLQMADYNNSSNKIKQELCHCSFILAELSVFSRSETLTKVTMETTHSRRR